MTLNCGTKTACNKCGDCCERIWVPVSPAQVENAKPEWENHQFMKKFWVHQESAENGRDHRYFCTKFDSVNRVCTAHEDRPPVCRDFPYYGTDTINVKFSERCSYNADTRTNLKIVQINGR